MTQAILSMRARVSSLRWCQLVGLTICLGGLGVVLQSSFSALLGAWAQAGPGAWRAFQASSIAGGATGLGALGLLALSRRSRQRGQFVFLAVSAGAMFAAAALSLLGPAVWLSRAPLLLDVSVAALLGYGAMAVLDRLLPHQHAVPSNTSRPARHAMRLMVVAIAIHNLPEGFAVGAGFGGGDALGWGVAISIGLQNIPEGLIVATALWSIGIPRGRAVVLALATGLLEPLGAAVGTLAAGLSATTLPCALAAAGGAMDYVVLEELIPEALRGPSPRLVALSFTLGCMGMAALLWIV